MKLFKYIMIQGIPFPRIYATYVAERIKYDAFEKETYEQALAMSEMSDYRKRVELRRLRPIVTKQLLWHFKLSWHRRYVLLLAKLKLIKIPQKLSTKDRSHENN